MPFQTNEWGWSWFWTTKREVIQVCIVSPTLNTNSNSSQLHQLHALQETESVCERACDQLTIAQVAPVTEIVPEESQVTGIEYSPQCLAELSDKVQSQTVWNNWTKGFWKDWSRSSGLLNRPLQYGEHLWDLQPSVLRSMCLGQRQSNRTHR